MTNLNAIKNFVKDWSGHGYEKGETQTFWLAFLRDVIGVDKPDYYIEFEVQVKLPSRTERRITGFMDAYLDDTKVIIEQKSFSVSLDDEDPGTGLTPFQQAKRYNDGLEQFRKARWIITSNFREFYIYDMNQPDAETDPLKIRLDELPEKFYAFDFLVDKTKTNVRIEEEISVKAGKVVKKLYSALRKLYLNPDSPASIQSLNKLCVRLVFILYAQSADVFGKRRIFTEMIERTADPEDLRRKLRALFQTLNTKPDDRDAYNKKLNIFPYIDGGIFAEENIEIPNIEDDARKILLEDACWFKWKDISPTIFGAVFEYTLSNADERKEGGMHFTAIRNIQKVIDPLFMDDLRAEFETAKGYGISALLEFQNKLASLHILDPACGSGNFLTESYISLRRLENLVLREILKLDSKFPVQIKVSIEQFFGIELNDFAVSVARTALWISEIQLKLETREELGKADEIFPIHTKANILEANALRYDWSKLISPSACNFIISNPPFVGKSYQSKEQKSDMAEVFVGVKGYGNLDYVASWYKKAADFIHGTNIRAAFVSTNSICQGIAVPPLWKYLFENGIHIDFAYKTFKWFSESSQMAQVHVVIISLSHAPNPKPKKFFSVAFELNDEGKKVEKIYAETVKNINAYLIDAPNIIIEPRASSICNVLPMLVGSCPTDGGGFIIEAEDYDAFVNAEPAALKYIRLYIGGEEFINGKKRYCLWLKDCPPNELRSMKKVFERVKAVKEFRLASKKEQTRRRAETPTLFAEDRYVNAPAIFMPMVSSENRDYVPIGFIDAETIANNKSLFIPNGNNYIFGVLISKVHMAWMKTVCGRLKSDYSYSATIVYNNFPWCSPTAGQRRAIEAAAAKILEVRAKYAGASLADLYDATAMPADLKRAHRENDAAVSAAYGFAQNLSEAEIVARLMKMYMELTKSR